jgi:thiamine-phosphate pyrophosphorylase
MVLCYVTDRHLFDEAAPLDALLLQIENAAAAGVDWIQIREKDLTPRELLDFTRRAIASAEAKSARNKRTPPQTTVNDRIDVALAAGAAGVHLSAVSIPPSEAVAWLRSGNAPANFSVGLSCHNVAEAVAAEQAGVNYIFFGPVYQTPSKANLGKPQGIDRLAEVCRRVRIPVLAIGGITETNAPACVTAGASGIAAIRMFQRKNDGASLMEAILRIRKPA